MVGKPSRTMLSEVKDGLEVMSRDVKKLVQGIKDLRHLGVEDLLLPLPKIAVVGDQSTGKSSLIEGIRYWSSTSFFSGDILIVNEQWH